MCKAAYPSARTPLTKGAARAWNTCLCDLVSWHPQSPKQLAVLESRDGFGTTWGVFAFKH